MRGKVRFVALCIPLFGITPAYAGKSGGKAALCGVLGDHPRVCGEKPTIRRMETPGQGSPPRMRGKD